MGGCFSSEPVSKKPSLDSNRWSDCGLDEFERRVNPLIDNIKLSRYRRNILKKRYTKLVIYYESYAADINKKYNLCRVIISVGSMILPTLQTIQNNETVASIKDEIFWAAIGTSLSVMISNNLISMFTLDRRYIMYAVTAEKLKAVGWKYFELSDIFSTKNHLENWVLFWNEVEKIKKQQVIAEFTDNDDKNHEPNPANTQSPHNSDNEDSDSDNTPRSPRTPPKSHRKYSKLNKKKNKNYEDSDDDDDVVIDLEDQTLNSKKVVNYAQQSFKKNFDDSDLRGSIENKITDGKDTIEKKVENEIENQNKIVEENVDNILGDLSKTIHGNLKNKDN